MFGAASSVPESYWAPWLGDICGLRPIDLGELTPEQLMDCVPYAESKGIRFG